MAKRQKSRKKESFAAGLRAIKEKSKLSPAELAKAAEGTPYGRPRYSYPGWWNLPGLVSYTAQQAGAPADVRTPALDEFFGYDLYEHRLFGGLAPLGTLGYLIAAVISWTNGHGMTALRDFGIAIIPCIIALVVNRYSKLLRRRDDLWRVHEPYRTAAARTDLQVANDLQTGLVNELREAATGADSDLVRRREGVAAELKRQRTNLARLQGEQKQAKRMNDDIKVGIYGQAVPLVEKHILNLEAARTRNERHAAKLNAYLDAFTSRLTGTYDVIATLGGLADQGVGVNAVIAASDAAIEASLQLVESGVAKIQPLLDQATEAAIHQLADASSADLDDGFSQFEQALTLIEHTRVAAENDLVRFSEKEDDEARWHELEEQAEQRA